MIKNSEDIKGMRVAGKLAAQTLEMIGEHVKPGISTGELDKICHDFIVDEIDCIPAPLNYKGFPKSICTSINQVVCHGIPTENRILKSNDIINIDVTVIKDGYHGDTSKMFMVGKAQPHAQRLVDITQECLYRGIEQVKPGARLGDIGHAIQVHAEGNHYSVVREYCGHGIGKVFHEDPQVLHYGQPNTRHVLTRRHVLYYRAHDQFGHLQNQAFQNRWLDGRDCRWQIICPMGTHHPSDSRRL